MLTILEDKRQPDLIRVGKIIDNDYLSDNWTSVGGATTWTYNSNSIGSIGTAGAFTNYIRYNKWYLQSERFTIKALVTINSIGVNDRFLGVGLAGASVFSAATNFQCAYYAQSGANQGLTTIYNYDGTQVATSGAARLTANVGDQIEYTVTFEFNVVTFSVRNMINPNTYQTISWTNSLALVYPGAASKLLPNINQIAFLNYYGDYTINDYSYTDNEYKNNYLVVIGDSKSEGYYADTFANRYANLIAWKTSGVVQVAAGSGNVTQDILNGINEILIKKPKYAVMCIGRNDIANGVAAGTWQYNYATIYTKLEASGIKVYHQLPLTETTLDQSALTTYINNTYSSNRIIPVPQGWNTSTDVNADGIHLSIQGNDKVYQNILNYIPTYIASYIPPLQSNLQNWYLNLITKPSQSVLNDLNDLFQGIENDGDLTEIDFLHPFGGLETDEQRLTPIKTTGVSPMVAVNSPTLNINGFTGNGTTSYVNSKWNATNHASKYAQNSSCIGVYNRTNRTQNTSIIMGCYSAGNYTRIYPFNTTLMIGTTNSVADSTATTTSSHGFLFAQRTASNSTTLYRNTTTLGSDSDLSVAFSNLEIFICGANSSGSFANGTTDNSALMVLGSSLVSQSRLEYRVRKYMTARGLNV